MSGHFGIGVFHPKFGLNVGTLWRSAYSLGAAYIFTVGKRYPHQPSDTTKSWRHIPLFEFTSFEDFHEGIPYGSRIVAVEIAEGALSLKQYEHPERCVYLLGAEDHGIPPWLLERCHEVIQLPGTYCLNVAVTGSIVMYDRIAKAAA